MLEVTLASRFEPGANLKGKLPGAAWPFLLPRLDLEKVLCLGPPSPATLSTLQRMAREVLVVEGWSGSRLPLEDASTDLAVLIGRSPMRNVQHGRGLADELRRVLRPDGLTYLEPAGPSSRRRCLSALDVLGDGMALWLGPVWGEVKAAVAGGEVRVVRFFVEGALHRAPGALSGRRRVLGRVRRLVSGSRIVSRAAPRYGALVGANSSPPSYLAAIARASGIDLDGYRWGLAAPGAYASQKILFFLFPPSGSGSAPVPRYVVKVPHSRDLSPRLENAWRALTQLRDLGIGDSETVPQPAFFGHHRALAIVGETALAGTGFRRRSGRSADCPYFASALEWILRLAEAPVGRSLADPARVAEGLRKLFGRFNEIYDLSSAHREFLSGEIESLGRVSEPFPAVIQHGDPGTWNLLVTASGRVAFLDWEAAEARGMPLWDLLYFMRSYGILLSRHQGVRDSLEGFARQYLADTELGQTLAGASRRLSETIGLAGEFVRPLFFTCWMHRALKEAGTLTPDRLESGRYLNLLRRCIGERDQPSLRRLFNG
ncbi:MAG: phosphotransferase family protein [Actinomycetota bacterium]